MFQYLEESLAMFCLAFAGSVVRLELPALVPVNGWAWVFVVRLWIRGRD